VFHRVVSSIPGLRLTLERLARKTWTDIAASRQLSVPMGETTLTDNNMLALRSELPSLVVYKHTAREEVLTGADWEWWLDTSDGWICLIFQAKLLSAEGRYEGITKGRTRGKGQIGHLLETCVRRSERIGGTVWPLYCFYNSWPGEWPADVAKFDGADPRAMSDLDLQLFGCGAADAWTVARIMSRPYYSRRYTLRDTYLPVTRPWSVLFPDPAESESFEPVQTLRALALWRRNLFLLPTGPSTRPPRESEPEQDRPAAARDRPGRPDGPDRPMGSGSYTDPDMEPPHPPEDYVTETELGAIERRDRQVIYRDPSLIQRPPDYVLDLLHGMPGRRRRLRPMARRLAVLPGEDSGF
jgi:hypothetical protein